MAFPLAALFFRAISSMVSWRNLASSSFTRSSFFSLSSLMDWVSNVDGSMLGKSFTTTGSRNSMKGTITNTRKGTRRKRSAQIRRNCKDVETSVGRAGQEHLSYHYYNSPQCDSDSWQITSRNPPLSHSLNMLMALRKIGLGANPQLTRCTECETSPKEGHLDKIAIYVNYPRTPPASRGTCEVL